MSTGEWLTTDAAVAYLGLKSRAAIYKRHERGQLKAYRLGRQFRFRRRDLDALMAVDCPPVSAVARED